MSDGASQTTNRRDVLKLVGGTAAVAATPAIGSVAAQQGTTPGERLKGKSVFVEDGVGVSLPAEASATNKMGKADVAMLSAETTRSRSEMIGAMDTGTMLSFGGAGADDMLVSTVFDEPRSEAGDTALAGGLTKPDDISRSVGIEYGQRTAHATALVPGAESAAVHQFRTTNGYSDELFLRSIDNTLARHAGGPAASQRFGAGDSPGANSSISMDEGEDEDEEFFDDTCPTHTGGDWTCVGLSRSIDDYEPYGQTEKEVACAKGQDDNSSLDWFTLEGTKYITPGYTLNSDYDNWRNDKMYRMKDFDDEHSIDWDPQNTSGSTSESTSLNLDVSVSSSDAGVTGGLAHSWSHDYPNVNIDTTYNITDTRIEHTFIYDNNTDIDKNSLQEDLGTTLEIEGDGVSSIDYGFEDFWRFVNNCGWFCTNYEKRTELGTAFWYV